MTQKVIRSVCNWKSHRESEFGEVSLTFIGPPYIFLSLDSLQKLLQHLKFPGRKALQFVFDLSEIRSYRLSHNAQRFVKGILFVLWELDGRKDLMYLHSQFLPLLHP